MAVEVVDGVETATSDSFAYISTSIKRHHAVAVVDMSASSDLEKCELRVEIQKATKP